LALALLKAIAVLPHRWGLRFGAALGFLALRVLPRRRRLIASNIGRCLPELDAHSRRELVKANEFESGRMLASFAAGWFGSPAAIAALPVTFHGLDEFRQLLERGRGVLLVGAHFSHLELSARLLTMRVPVAGMYREHNDPAMEWAVRRARLRYACAMFRRDELRAAIRHVKNGGVLWYAPDQAYRRGDHALAPFFGIPAPTLTATHHLARLTGAAVVGFAHWRAADGYHIELLPALENFPSSDALADTARVNRLLEDIIRRAPDQYLWLHDRFKPTAAPVD
jgi:KDO2-lipid IV(A) lauroyltransferase